MATIRFSPLFGSIQGRIGDLVVRRCGKKHILAARPQFTSPATAGQQAHREKFGAACRSARHLLQDPSQRKRLERLAKKTRTTAYRTAVSEIMRGS